MKILFIGGTGTISSACSQLAVERGYELSLLNRGQTTSRPPPEAAHLFQADTRDPQAVRRALGDEMFDVVVNWYVFTPDQIEADLELYRGRTEQYIFISSASAYQTPPSSLPVTESTPLDNPYWDYSRAKIACEERLVRAYRDERFPMTIVRPSHTYDKTRLVFDEGYTVINRMRQGKKVIVHGDGTSLWVLTHHRDFAKGFTGLLGNPAAIGEAFHITSDEWLSWNQIFEICAQAAGAEARLVHIPTDLLVASYPTLDETALSKMDPIDRLKRRPNLRGSLMGDRANSMVFDNSKIKRMVPDFAATIPFAHGAKEVLAWYDADPSRRVVDEEMDQLMDRIIDAYEAAWP
jgi:nucleoside-diphosphate-sugar epimerase